MCASSSVFRYYRYFILPVFFHSLFVPLSFENLLKHRLSLLTGSSTIVHSFRFKETKSATSRKKEATLPNNNKLWFFACICSSRRDQLRIFIDISTSLCAYARFDTFSCALCVYRYICCHLFSIKRSSKTSDLVFRCFIFIHFICTKQNTQSTSFDFVLFVVGSF